MRRGPRSSHPTVTIRSASLATTMIRAARFVHPQMQRGIVGARPVGEAQYREREVAPPIDVRALEPHIAQSREFAHRGVLDYRPQRALRVDSE